MVYKILVDVNILQDVLSRRQDFQGSSDIILLVKRKLVEGWISANTFYILYYLQSKVNSEAITRQKVKDLLEGFSIIPVRQSTLKNAIESDLPDFEDNIQIESALQFNLDAIITRNKKHFEQDKIPVFTPEEFIEIFKKQEVKNINFVDLKAQHHQVYNEIDDKITDVITSCNFILGNEVKKFEESFAEVHNVKHCLAVSSGTDALHLALWSLGIGRGDEVITVPNTFIATTGTISLTGARPVFVDIDEKSYNIDVNKIEKAINKNTKAIISVHLYGQPVDIDPILKIAEKYGIHIIEDACQSHLAEYKGKKVGGIGHIGCFSFYPSKNLGAYGEGGAIVTSDTNLFEKMYKFREHGQSKKYYYDFEGHNYRMENIQGAILNVKLKYLELWTEKRRKNAQLYNEFLKSVENVIIPFEMDYAKHVYHLYVIRIKNRDGLQKFLTENHVSTGYHYPVPLHLQKAYKYLGYKTGDFPVAETVCKEIISLPMYAELQSKEIEYVASLVRNFVANY
jgi:dTDP-4-amino-4,6-dideoxygalactose transaminase/predicted nucleic acid-binding protein